MMNTVMLCECMHTHIHMCICTERGGGKQGADEFVSPGGENVDNELPILNLKWCFLTFLNHHTSKGHF